MANGTTSHFLTNSFSAKPPASRPLGYFPFFSSATSGAGAADCCHLVVGAEGHRFYADQSWPVMLKEIQALK
jgi:hypothetical protein